MVDPMPTVAALTRRIYDSLPELYRDADAAQDSGPDNYPLLRYLSCIFDPFDAVEDIYDRVNYVPQDEQIDTHNWRNFSAATFGAGTFGDGDTSELVDPLIAPASWLPWIARLFGVNIDGLDIPAARAALARPNRDKGTANTIAAAVRAAIPAATYIKVEPHYTGDPFVIGLHVIRDEVLTISTWRNIEAEFPTWAHWEAAGTWQNIHATILLPLLAEQRPAGYRLDYVQLRE